MTHSLSAGTHISVCANVFVYTHLVMSAGPNKHSLRSTANTKCFCRLPHPVCELSLRRVAVFAAGSVKREPPPLVVSHSPGQSATHMHTRRSCERARRRIMKPPLGGVPSTTVIVPTPWWEINPGFAEFPIGAGHRIYARRSLIQRRPNHKRLCGRSVNHPRHHATHMFTNII